MILYIQTCFDTAKSLRLTKKQYKRQEKIIQTKIGKICQKDALLDPCRTIGQEPASSPTADAREWKLETDSMSDAVDCVRAAFANRSLVVLFRQ